MIFKLLGLLFHYFNHLKFYTFNKSVTTKILYKLCINLENIIVCARERGSLKENRQKAYCNKTSSFLWLQLVS